jgi:hypothetical protein
MKSVQAVSRDRNHRALLVLFLFSGSLVPSQPAESAGTTISGNIEQIAPPASVVIGVLESNSLVRLFNERSAFVLNQNLMADITQPSTVGSPIDLSPGLISPQLVDSHLLHADPIGPGNPAVTYQGSVTFDRPILGLLVQGSTLTPTDGLLGSPSTIYTPTVNRGFEWPSTSGVGDLVQLSADFRTVTFVLKATSQYDQIRVITAGIPEPSALALVACCVGVALIKRPRRND